MPRNNDFVTRRPNTTQARTSSPRPGTDTQNGSAHVVSSPSVYSQEDLASETEDSDDEATKILAQADSGPRRPDPCEAENVQEEAATEEQVERAKKVVYGSKASKR